MNARPAIDVVVVVFAACVAIVLVLTTIGVVVIEIVNPDQDTAAAIDTVSETLGVLVGALVGLIGGVPTRATATTRRRQGHRPAR